MRLVVYCHLILLSITFAKSDFALASQSGDPKAESRIQVQVRNYRKSAPRQNRKPRFTTYKSIRAAKYRGYKVTQIPKYDIPAFLTREDMNKIIPSNMTGNEPSSEVLKKMGDKAVNVWLKSSSMQKVSIVQAAQKVEQAMKAEVNFAETEDDVQHKLNFEVQAFQTLSKVDYKGYVDATVSYNVREQKAGYEVRRKVLRNKDLFVNHSDGKSEDLSSVGLKWSF